MLSKPFFVEIMRSILPLVTASLGLGRLRRRRCRYIPEGFNVGIRNGDRHMPVHDLPCVIFLVEDHRIAEREFTAIRHPDPRTVDYPPDASLTVGAHVAWRQ